MEAIAQFDEVRLLARRLHVHRAAIDHRVVGDDADDFSVHARQRDDHGLAEGRLNLEQRVAVDDRMQRGVACRRAGGDPPARCVEGFLAAVVQGPSRQPRVASSQTFCGMYERNRRISAKHSASVSTRLSMLPATSTADRGTAQLVLGDLLAKRALDNGRTRGEHLTGAAHHHRPMGENGAPGGTASSSSEHRADRRAPLPINSHRALEAMHTREDRVSPRLIDVTLPPEPSIRLTSGMR